MTKKRHPDPPAWLGEAGAAEWHRVVPELTSERQGAMFDPVLDRAALEAYCSAVERLAFWRGLRHKYGCPEYNVLDNGQSGADSMAQHFIAQTLMAETCVLELAAALGLTPASRATISYQLVVGR